MQPRAAKRRVTLFDMGCTERKELELLQQENARQLGAWEKQCWSQLPAEEGGVQWNWLRHQGAQWSCCTKPRGQGQDSCCRKVGVGEAMKVSQDTTDEAVEGE
eukprot:scaffold80563_cov15-Tisochrysis_lutea.AAC.1